MDRLGDSHTKVACNGWVLSTFLGLGPLTAAGLKIAQAYSGAVVEKVASQ